MATLANGLAIGYHNLASGKTIIATTQASGFSAAALNTPRLRERWHSTALIAQNVDVDLGSSLDYDVVGILGSNLEDTATRRMYGDDVSNFATPDWDPDSSNAFDISTPPLIAGRVSWPPFGRHVLQFPGTTRTDRYIRAQLSNAGNADGYLRGSVYWVSRILQLPFDYSWEPGPAVIEGEPGLERVYRTHQFTSRALTSQQQVYLESLFYTLKRSGRCLIVPQPLKPETWIHKALYGTFKGEPRSIRMLASDDLWQVSYGFVEVLD